MTHDKCLREWTITKCLYIYDRGPNSPSGNQLVSIVDGPDCQQVKVIEYSAFEAMRHERDVWKEEAETCAKHAIESSDLLHQREKRVDQLKARVEELEAELAKAKGFDLTTAIMAKDQNVDEENKKLRDQLEAARKENEELMREDYWQTRAKTAEARAESFKKMAESYRAKLEKLCAACNEWISIDGDEYPEEAEAKFDAFQLARIEASAALSQDEEKGEG